MLAYIDSYAGLVACKVLEIEETPNRVRWCKIRVTSRNHADFGYPCGKIMDFTSRAIVPRDKVIRKKSMAGPTILPYDLANYMPIQLSLDTTR